MGPRSVTIDTPTWLLRETCSWVPDLRSPRSLARDEPLSPRLRHRGKTALEVGDEIGRILEPDVQA
jgi:hypothetical protein